MPHHASQASRLTVIAGIAVVLGVTIACYWPALSGPFIFDDFPNLSRIGDYGGVHSWDSFLRFVLGGGAGPLGRPVSLASFLLNAQDWPASPYPFKLTNLGLHLLNGLLIYSLATQLLKTQHALADARKMALLAMAFWLLHPLLVSTTAFVVQRMTQLSCLFVLAGLVGYLHGRQLLDHDARRGWCWILTSMTVGGSLAVLSKESGVLLPLYALIIEATVFSSDRTGRKRCLLALFWLPVAGLAAYLATLLIGIEGSYQGRSFTLTERLLTEARILVDYLSRTFLPRMKGAGLYHDDFAISSSLLSPPSTILSIAGLSLLLLAGWGMRKSRPILACAILWFFAGHCLESSFIPLELYYEHRNYLPITGFAIAAGGLSLSARGLTGKSTLSFALIFIALEAFMTWQNARMWSSQHQLVHISVQEHPTSLRALERAGLYYAAKRDYEKTLGYLEQAVHHHPDRTAIKLSVIQTKCLLNRLTASELSAVTARIARARHEKETIQYLPEFVRLAQKQVCTALDFSALHKLLDAIETQADLPGPGASRYSIHYQRAMLYAAEGKHAAAMASIDAANAIKPTIDLLLQQAVWMISVRNYKLAQQYLDEAATLNQQRSTRDISRKVDIEGFQSLIDKKFENPEFIPFQYPLTRKDPA